MASILNLIERFWWGVGATLVALQVAVLAGMGVPLICKCGEVKLWAGAGSANASQHLADWYSLSHMVHGVLFYALVCWLWPQGSVRLKILAVMALEIGWELFENLPWVVHRFRTQTADSDYTGDTLLNSVSDVVFMLAGLALALKLPVRWVVVFVCVAELVALVAMRDNLTLQMLTFIWPIDALVDWQSRA